MADLEKYYRLALNIVKHEDIGLIIQNKKISYIRIVNERYTHLLTFSVERSFIVYADVNGNNTIILRPDNLSKLDDVLHKIEWNDFPHELLEGIDD